MLRKCKQLFNPSRFPGHGGVILHALPVDLGGEDRRRAEIVARTGTDRWMTNEAWPG
jgi:hypothetical protein